MTVISSTSVPAVRHSGSWSRISAVARLHFVDRFSILGLPWMIQGFILLVNIAIWYLVLAVAPAGNSAAHTEKGFSYSGSVFYIFVYMMIVAVQAMARTFPFALGYGVTRRNYYLGSALTFALLSLLYSAGLTILSVIEIATHGWGAGGHLFAPAYFTSPSWFIRFLMYLFLLLFFFFLGSAVAGVFVRWRTTGMIVFFGILGLLLLGAVALLTLARQWQAVGDWFTATGSFGVTAWSLIPTAIAAIAGYFILQRATPKS